MKINKSSKATIKISDIADGECFIYEGVTVNETNLFIKLSFEGSTHCSANSEYCFGAKVSSGNVWAFKPDTEIVPVDAEVNVVK